MRTAHHRARLAAAGGLLAAAAYWGPSSALVSTRVRRALGVYGRLAADDAVALTFDDGPHPGGTPAVLDALARDGASATFFLVGEQVRRHPALAAQIVAAGHEVALHCDRHRNLMRLAPGQARLDLERACAAISEAAGREPRVYRPPYGILTAPALAAARRHGWRTLLWTRHGEDWSARATAGSIAGRILGPLLPGDVVLLHDGDAYSAPGSWTRTVDALPQILDGIRARGLRVSPLAVGLRP